MVNQSKPANRILIVHYLKITKLCMPSCMPSNSVNWNCWCCKLPGEWAQGQNLALLLWDLMLLLCNSCSKCPPKNPWPSSLRIFNMMIYHHIYLFHYIFCFSSFKDLLILMTIAPKAIFISSSSFLFSSFCKMLMNCLVKSSCSCLF